MRTTLRRVAAAAGVVTLLVLGAAPGALAEPPEESGAVTRGTSEPGGVYWEAGYIVLVGTDDFVSGCLGVGMEPPPAMFVQPGDGSFQDHIRSWPDEPFLVFTTDVASLDDVFPWIGAACAAALDGDPATIAPKPVATGSGRVQQHVRVDTDGVAHIHNSVIGKATTTDGQVAHLSTFAKLTQSAAGLDVQQLRVNYGG